MDTAVSSKTERRRGETRENILHGYLTEEQRSRRPVFDETLRAEALLYLFFVGWLPKPCKSGAQPCCALRATQSRSQILADMLPPRFANKSKIALSSSVQNFSTGCYIRMTAFPSHTIKRLQVGPLRQSVNSIVSRTALGERSFSASSR